METLNQFIASFNSAWQQAEWVFLVIFGGMVFTQPAGTTF